MKETLWRHRKISTKSLTTPKKGAGEIPKCRKKRWDPSAMQWFSISYEGLMDALNVKY